MPSVRTLAAHLKLSPATVSRVLNNHPDVDAKTRQRVLARINATGYVPKVGRRVTNVIALAYPDQPVRSEYGSFEPSLLSGVMRGLQDHHYDIKLLSIRRDKLPHESYTQFFLRKGIQGVLLRCVHRTSDMIKQIAKEGFPSVVVAARFDEPEVNFIDSDSYPSSRRAMEHLIGLGHRRIVLAIHNVSDTDHADRRRAYEDAIATADMPVDADHGVGCRRFVGRAGSRCDSRDARSADRRLRHQSDDGARNHAAGAGAGSRHPGGSFRHRRG